MKGVVAKEREWAPADCYDSGADIHGVRHPGIPCPLQARPSETVDTLQHN